MEKKFMLTKYFSILLLIIALPLSAQINIDIDQAIHVKSFAKSDIFADVYSINIGKGADKPFSLIKPYATRDNKLLLSCWPSELYLYDLEGKFLKRIHSGDQLPVNTYDRDKNYFYLEVLDGGVPTWYGIDLKIGEVVTRLPKPSIYEKQIVNFKRTGADEYVCFVNNQSGNDSVFVVFFDGKGKVKCTIPEARTYKKNGEDNPYFQGQFYDYDGKHYFKELLWGTTVYEIGDCKLIPHIQFDLGSKTPNYAYRDMPEKNKGTYQLGTVMETDTRIYFSYNVNQETFWGYYSKADGKTYVTKLPSKDKITDKGDSCNFLPAWDSGFETVTAIQSKDKEPVIVVGDLK